MSAVRQHSARLVHALRAVTLGLTLTGCTYTPQQLACMHARDRAEHHGVVAGVGVAVVVVVLAVTVYARRHPAAVPSPRRALAAALLTLLSIVPVAVLFALLGSSWMGRNYHCGDGQDLPLTLLLILAAFPAAIAVPASAGLLLWAKREWHRKIDR
jgi:branched-subunit amino acid transport protein